MTDGNISSENQELKQLAAQICAEHQGVANAAATASTDPVLAEHVNAIRALGKRVVSDVTEIGRHLDESKIIVGHGNFGPWLDREFGWSDKTAENFINVHKLSSKFENFSNLDLPLSGLYLLAAPSTPDEARTEIIERAQTGEPVSVAEIKRAIGNAKGQARKKPTPQPSASFDVGADFADLLLKVPGWTGAVVGTQIEVDAAIERLRDDGAPGHWLMVAPRERVVVDHRVIQWLLITSPAPPVIAHIEWVMALCGAADKARCPVWVSERLTGKSRPQRPGMTWPRELPIPRELPALRADSPGETPLDGLDIPGFLRREPEASSRQSSGEIGDDRGADHGADPGVDGGGNPHQDESLEGDHGYHCDGDQHRGRDHLHYCNGELVYRDGDDHYHENGDGVARGDIGVHSIGEAERLRARNEELENKGRRLEAEKANLKNEIEALKVALQTNDAESPIAEGTGKSSSCTARWRRWIRAATAAGEALRELSDIQEEYQGWRDSLPENLANSAVGGQLDEVCNLDFGDALEIIEQAEGLDLPVAFGGN